MRKIIIAALLALATLSGSAKGIDFREDLTRFAKTYDAKAGFEVVKIGKFLMSIAKTAVAAEDKDTGKAIKDIDNMLVVDYSEASKNGKQDFETKLGGILRKAELIIEAKEGGELVRIYGQTDGQKVNDLVIFTPSECALVCLFGTVSLDDLDLVVKEYD